MITLTHHEIRSKNKQEVQLLQAELQKNKRQAERLRKQLQALQGELEQVRKVKIKVIRSNYSREEVEYIKQIAKEALIAAAESQKTLSAYLKERK